MATISEALAIALQHHQAGQLPQAEQIYRQILEVEPNHADAWHLLGVLAHQVGQYAVAIEYIQRATALVDNEASYHGNLGAAYFALKRTVEAIPCYRRAIELNATCAESHCNLGNALKDQGDIDGAINEYRRALELRPNYPSAFNNLGFALASQGKLEDAVAAYSRALDLMPDFPLALNNCGVALAELGKINDAKDFYSRAIELKPDYSSALNNLGIAHTLQGELERAVDYLNRAIQSKPDFAVAYCSLGNALKELRRLDDAVECYQHAIRLAPSSSEAFSNLAATLLDQGRLIDSFAYHKRAIELSPNDPIALSNLLWAYQYKPSITISELSRAHAEYDRISSLSPTTYCLSFPNTRDPDRIVRIGFVSGDFGLHPTGYLMASVLENLDRSQCLTYCFSNRIIADYQTALLRQACDKWHDTVGLTDERLAQLIRDQRVDILIDLSGHTANNRLQTFPLNPAPIQASWLGGVGPPGLSSIKYFIADHSLVSDELLSQYREHVIRLPTIWCCKLPVDAPDVAPLPTWRTGHVTFGSFNNLAKINPLVVQTWARILKQLPTARLVMKYRGLDSPSVTERYRALFAAEGIDSSRIELQGESPFAEMLDTYNAQVDIALDPFPFNGGMTTMLALYMGVPVITCPGETVASRQSLAILTALGMSETVARDLDEYVDLAVALANDLPRLAELRSGLRQRCLESPLYDGPKFARDLMDNLRQVWREWVAKNPG